MEQTERAGASRLIEYARRVYRVGTAMRRVIGRSRIKHPRLLIGIKQSLVAQIARLESLKDSVCGRFVHAGAGYSAGLRWRMIDTANDRYTTFENSILTGAVINSKHIESHQFFEDARKIVLERVQSVMQQHDNIKINTVFNGEFVAGDKYANKSIATRNYKLFQTSNLHEWYELRVVEPILTSLEEFQEHIVDGRCHVYSI